MSLPAINFENASVHIPIYNSEAMSLRRRLFGKTSPPRIVHALENITLKIEHGERVGLYGHNGAGKLTFLKCLAGGYYPNQGRLSITGSVNSLIDINIGLDAEATGLQNITLKLTMMGVPQKRFETLIGEIVDFSELGDAIYLPLRTYSTGMAMRLAFAICTTVKSDILLLDEWLSVGDEGFADKASKKMNQLKSESSIMVLASHNYHLLESVCNRIIKLSHGSVIEDILL